MHKAERWSVHRPTGSARPAGYVLLLFRVVEDDGHWVGLCEELDVSSFGETREEALDATLEATELYLNTLEEMGERERVFGERKLELTDFEPEDTTERQIVVHPGEIVSPQRLVLVNA